MNEQVTMDEAVLILDRLMFVIPKLKSNAIELFGDGPGSSWDRLDKGGKLALQSMFPDLFSEDPDTLRLLEVVQAVLDKHRKSGFICPIDFYNVMFLVDKNLAVKYGWSVLGYEPPLPEPTLALVKSWRANS